MILKAQMMVEKIENLDYIKIKTSVLEMIPSRK